MRSLQFAVPPSLGALKAAALSAHLGTWLRRTFRNELEFHVRLATSYAELRDWLTRNEVDLAWAPPAVCATLEHAGGAVLAQCERAGATTFRAAFIGRKDKPLAFPAFDSVRVAWVDRESTAGYLLPRAWLSAQGLDLKRAFSQELFAGSYHLSLVALVSRRADLATTFAAPESARGGAKALDGVPAALRDGLTVLGYTSEVANDGVVSAPKVDVGLRQLVRARLTASADAELKAIFGAERLVPATKGAYLSLA